MSVPPVKGLLLSGGQSRRMGTDKGLLCYANGTSEVERWEAIFDALAVPFFWSQRPGQYPYDLFPHITRIVDQNPGSGPLGALMSAYRLHPGNAWLVLACDWPLLGLEDIRYLLEQRHPERTVTSYVHEGRRQPLCSLYEPEFLQQAALDWEAGQQSLSHLLQAADAWELSVFDAKRFLNVNDPTMRQQVEEEIRKVPSPVHPNQNDH
jgi:molybdopterin-guanine dinucleotide biosynthesis protein A